MRHHNLFIYLLPYMTIMLLFCGCSKPRVIAPDFPWPSTGVAEADSIMLEFEKLRNNLGADSMMKKGNFAERLRNIAYATKSDVIGFRASYVELCADRLDSTAANNRAFAEKALLKIDSAAHPYEWHKMIGSIIESYPSRSDRYEKLLDNIAFFKRCHDEVEVARHYVMAGNLMTELQDSLTASMFFKEADDIFTRKGLFSNAAISMYDLSLIAKENVGDSIRRKLMADSVVLSHPCIEQLVNHGHFINHPDSESYLDRAIFLGYNGGDEKMLPVLRSSKAALKAMAGKPEEAVDSLCAILKEMDGDTYPYRIFATIDGWIADCYEEIGNPDSALYYLRMQQEMSRKMEEDNNPVGVYAVDIKKRQQLMENNFKLREQKWTAWVGAAVAILFSAGLTFYFFARKRKAERLLREKYMEEKLQRLHNSMQTQNVIIEEKSHLIDDISRQLDGEKGPMDSEPDLQGIRRMLKLHSSGSDSREALLMIRQSLNANLERKLKEVAPSITEGQIHLASLIVAGCDSAMISQILGITLSSLHKSRYRLRAKLGLSAETDLNDYLKCLNDGV